MIAGRLAAAGHRALLLEAGGTDEKYLVRRAEMVAAMHAEERIKKTIDWGYSTTPQKHALDRVMQQNRGRMLGGSSSVNGMLWVRGNRANYDDWAAGGCRGWDADTVNAVYRRMEDFEDGADDFRGAGGPVPITRNPYQSEASLAFLDGATQALGTPIIDDYNGPDQQGVSRFQANIRDGIRMSASRTYLHGRDLPGLTVATGMTVTNLVIRNHRAVGVDLLDSTGLRRSVRATAEVIVSAGVFGSPQVLMLSGLGPAGHLHDRGIDVVEDLPVGENLHDHLYVPVTCHADTGRSGTAGFFAEAVAADLAGRATFLRHTLFESVAFVRTSMAADIPDLQLHVLPWSYPSPNSDDLSAVERDAAPSLTVHSTLIYPESRGTVRLAGTDPTAAPLIDFNYLESSADVEVLAEGVEIIREIMDSPAMRRWVRPELHPGRAVSGSDLREQMRLRATTVYHGVGSCRMGVDEASVVDPELRVRGIDGLRVADASVMPSIIGGNTNAPSMMIGERAADLVLGGAPCR